MSYDIELYTRTDPTREFEAMAQRRGLRRQDDSVCMEGRGWQVVFNPVDRVETEDVPLLITQRTGGLSFLIEVNMEGRVPWLARRKALGLTEQIARACKGVVLDRQRGIVFSSDGTFQIDVESLPPKQEEVTVNWWFEDAIAFRKEGFLRLYELLESDFTEALPRRYGYHEPPQFKLAQQGRDHFLSLLGQHLEDDALVWYPSKPLTYVGYSIPRILGGTQRGYRCCNLAFHASRTVLNDQARWNSLHSVFVTISTILNPFFAEIRKGETPVKSIWWSGIPSPLGIATIIGPPYAAHWPEFVSEAKPIGDDLYLIGDALPRQSAQTTPPAAIRMPIPPQMPREGLSGPEFLTFMETDRQFNESRSLRYPEVWPLPGPFA